MKPIHLPERKCPDCDLMVSGAPTRSWQWRNSRWQREYCDTCQHYRSPGGQFRRYFAKSAGVAMPNPDPLPDSQSTTTVIETSVGSHEQVVVQDYPEFQIREFCL